MIQKKKKKKKIHNNFALINVGNWSINRMLKDSPLLKLDLAAVHLDTFKLRPS